MIQATTRKLALSLSMLLLPALAAAQTAAAAPKWALAIHGGAGTIPKNLPEAQKQQYLKSLTRALEIGREVLKGGGTSLDAVEKVVRFLEDDPLFNAGKGAVYTHEGTHELDAAIMDGRDLSCGSVRGFAAVGHSVQLGRPARDERRRVVLVTE